MACNVTCVRHGSELIKTKWLAIEPSTRLTEKHWEAKIAPKHCSSNQHQWAQDDECNGPDYHLEEAFERRAAGVGGGAAAVCGARVVEDRKRPPHTHDRTQFGFIECATACAHLRELLRRSSCKI